ncbi:MAG: hypothetical protein ACRCTR_02655 [Actinomycetota bacterium]
MKRSTFLDRIATVTLGLGLIGLGLSALAWWADVFNWSRQFDVRSAIDFPLSPWWAWGLGGAVASLTALWWMSTHLRSSRVKYFPLPGSDVAGQLIAQAKPTADAAANRVSGTLGVRRAQGVIVRRYRQNVLQLDVTIDPAMSLTAAAESGDHIADEVNRVLPHSNVLTWTRLRVARHHRRLSRVR